MCYRYCSHSRWMFSSILKMCLYLLIYRATRQLFSGTSADRSLRHSSVWTIGQFFGVAVNLCDWCRSLICMYNWYAALSCAAWKYAMHCVELPTMHEVALPTVAIGTWRIIQSIVHIGHSHTTKIDDSNSREHTRSRILFNLFSG